MFKFVEIAVELKKGRIAKDGLFQFRIISQHVNVASLEEVIRYFLKLATDRAEAAQAKAAEMLSNVDDLEEDITPEQIILSYVSADSDKDRIDREEVTPWFRFLWETYRTVLEVLKNNSKLESLYAMTAQRAFAFCRQYSRITEMRRLCDMLRNHLSNLNKWRDQRDRPELSLPETFSLYMETRFEQLRTAVDLEMWQEAFRTIEDIHGLVVQVRREPKPQHLATYYSMLTKIFYKSGNEMYAAFAWNKLFTVSKNYNKNLTPGDLEALASAVVLSTVAVPPYSEKANAAHYELAAEQEQKQRMSALLNLSFTPVKKDTTDLTREWLLEKVVAGALPAASPLAVSVYKALEDTFAPLKLAKVAAPLIDSLCTTKPELSAAFPVPDMDLSTLRPALENLGLLRVLEQVSSVYSTMSISSLLSVVPFATLTPALVEKTVVKAVRAGFLRVTMDHRKRSLSFGATRLEDSSVRAQLADVTKRLAAAVGMIVPDSDPAQAQSKAKTMRECAALCARENADARRRKVLIERRKEEAERRAMEEEKAEEEERIKTQREHEETEARRQQVEASKREQERIEREMAEKEKQEALAMLQEQQARLGKKGKKVTLEDAAAADKEKLMQDAITDQIKARSEMAKRLGTLTRKMDHLERAKLELERDYIVKASKERGAKQAELFKEEQERAIKAHRAQWERDIEEKKRMLRMGEEINDFAMKLQARRHEEYKVAKAARDERVAEARAGKKAEIERRRREAYLDQLIRDADALDYEEEEKQRAEEEAKRAEEEARRREEEERRSGGGWQSSRRGGGGYDDRRGGGYDDRRGGGGYDDRRGGGYDDRRGGGYDDRRSGGYDDRRGGYDDRRGGGGGFGSGGGGNRW